ncbi:hypothetical protein JZK55_00510 [Dissulfurispira thermophila]|uniref:HEPN domain-containing protein n=2 Tax=root TaxID=1 RepID=A0A7G1GYR7_9BACT|nr:hypothetical protein [Dissulfurispira thermophila]BCB95129.1 hypothetical protein JZK55_00510 [Dissulfurispira thermophila]
MRISEKTLRFIKDHAQRIEKHPNHEYSDNEDEIARGINKLFEISKRLCEIYEKI